MCLAHTQIRKVPWFHIAAVASNRASLIALREHVQVEVKIAGYTAAIEQLGLRTLPTQHLKACDDALKLDSAALLVVGDKAEKLAAAARITGACRDLC